MSYRNSLLAQSMSPELNHRTDRYAGPAALSRAVFGAVRAACRDDFIIEIQVSGEEPTENGYKIGDLIEYVKDVEDLVDIVQIRSADAATAHPLGLNSQRGVYDTMRYAKAMKEAGVRAVVAPVGGYHDPEYNDMAIRNGWCDMIYMARAFICDSEYGKKVAEGRREDIIPCVRCNKCHHSPWTWGYGCTANPKIAVDWDDNITRTFPDAPVPKKVAVIGGGPAGMWAALTAARRGHRVTLFEKNGRLGGQLLHADYADFKWPLREYKEYLVAQLQKSSVEVRLNSAVTPEEAKESGFEAVLLALGSEPVLPSIPGSTREHVHTPISVYGEKEKTLGERVVVIGGSETGVETGLYLARAGHKVHLITRADRLAKDAQPVHYIDVLTHMYNTEPNFEYTKFSETTEITDSEVVIRNDEGTFRIPCDDVVLCGGVRPRQEEALRWMELFDSGAARPVGDCQRPGDVRTGIRSAYIAAMML